MDYIQITENLVLIQESDCIALGVRDRESDNERWAFCKLDSFDINRLRQELGH